MKRIASLMLFIMLASILAACGSGGTTTTATTAPAPTTAAAPTSAPEPAATAATAPTTAAAATAPATTGGGAAAGTVTGEITLWHAYGTGSAEEKAITQIVENATKAFPEAKISVLQIPFNDVFTKFETEAAAGGGPDMFIAPNDNLGKEVRANLLAPVDDLVKGKIGNLSKLSIEGMTVDGKLYAVPESLKAVGLYYNKSKVASPPKTTADLLKLVQGGNTIAINQNAYHNFGFWGAYGGKLFDSSNKFIADQGGFVDALTFLQTLKKESNAQFYTDGGKADTAFKEGTADMIINGPWALGDYKDSLKENLAVAAVPGASSPASPLTGVDGFYINANSKNKESAANLALFMSQGPSAQIYVDVSGHVPADQTIKITDPLVQGFADAAATGYARPQVPQLDNYWTPFGDAINAVLDEGKAPADAVKEATEKANQAGS